MVVPSKALIETDFKYRPMDYLHFRAYSFRTRPLAQKWGGVPFMSMFRLRYDQAP